MSHVMIYFVASPKVVANRLWALRVHPDLGAGVAQEILEQSVVVASDPDITKVCYATLIPDSLLAAAREKPQFRGKGLQEVKDNYPVLYSHIAQKMVELGEQVIANRTMKPRVMIDMADALPAGATLIAEDLPLHAFSGYDPWTGDRISLPI